MQTLQQRFQEPCLTPELATNLAKTWRSRLALDCPQQSIATRESIINWLLGNDLERFEHLNPTQLEIAKQAMVYRYCILRQRYLDVSPQRAYRHLTTRLNSLVLLRNKVRTFVALSRDRRRTVEEVLQEVLQELLQRDRYMQQQIAWINECTSDTKLRNALLFSSLEEYCLRPIRNQPLLVYRFVNYLRRTHLGGLTQTPNNSSIRLISEELLQDDDNILSLIDTQASDAYQDRQAMEEKQAVRQVVKQEFSSYLAKHLGATAAKWLQLYLQGQSQEAIAQQLNVSVQEVYRLREKVTYHAVRVFALKSQPELVNDWLDASLQEHNLGLTPQQWQLFWQKLTPLQRQVLQLKQTGKDVAAIAQVLKLTIRQVTSDWHQICFTAQSLRSRE